MNLSRNNIFLLMDPESAILIINTLQNIKCKHLEHLTALNVINLLKTHKNKKKNKFIVSERQYIGITATINAFRSTLASCEDLHRILFDCCVLTVVVVVRCCLVSLSTPPSLRRSRRRLVHQPPTAVFHFLLEATSSSHPN